MGGSAGNSGSAGLGGGAGSSGTAGTGASSGGTTAGGSAGSTSGGIPSEWTESTCATAIDRGITGDPCSGTFECQSAVLECCRWSASCVLGQLRLARTCELCACKGDADCKTGSWCDKANGNCRACVETPVCLPPFSFIQRNGCAYCIPPDDCQDDGDCNNNGGHCYAGQLCGRDCVNDPSCCFGNRCAAPGCGPTTGLDCSLFGCPDGTYCDIQDVTQRCVCNQGRWLCTGESPNVCRPL